MRKNTLLLSILSLAFATACATTSNSPSSPSTPSSTPSEPAGTSETPAAPPAEAPAPGGRADRERHYGETRAELTRERARFEAAARQGIEEINRQIESISVRVSGLMDEEAESAQRELDVLTQRRDDVVRQIENLPAVADETFNDARVQIERALERLNREASEFFREV